MPSAGATITRGGTVYRVNQVKIPLLYGTVPLYRPLRPGDHGADVAEVERNLHALGHTGFTVDDDLTSATASAIRSFQDDLGATKTGSLAPGDVVVASSAIRITTVAASAGDPANGPVARYTGTVRKVTISLDVALQDLVHNGVAAIVTLPDNS